MCRRMTVFAGILIGLLSHLPALPAEPTTQPVDPAELIVPKSPPEFRQVVHPDAWQRRFDAALAELGGIKGLEESKALDFGEVVLEVRKTWPAQVLGFAVDEIITQVDGVALRGKSLDAARRDEAQKITVIGKNGQTRVIDVGPDPLGLDSEAIFRPDLVYIRSGARGPAWDGFAAIGAACTQRDPALAETAWRAAIAAGYQPDFISDLCGALISWRQGRNDEAVAFLASMETRPKRYPELSPELWVRRIGLANFKLKQALAGRMILDARPPAPKDPAGEMLNAELLAYSALPLGTRLRPSPLQLTQLKKDNLLGELTTLVLNAPSDEYDKAIERALRNRGTIGVLAPAERCNVLLLESKVETGDVELEVRAKVNRTDNIPGWNKKTVFVAIIDRDAVKRSPNSYPGAGGMLCVAIHDTGRIAVIQGAERSRSVQKVDARLDTANRQSMTIRLIHADGRDEVWLNKQRILYLPSLDRPRNLGVHFAAVGMTGDLDVRMWKLNPPP